MPWFAAACLTGATGALLRYWGEPAAFWVNIAGLVFLLLAVFGWMEGGTSTPPVDTTQVAGYPESGAGSGEGQGGSDGGAGD